MSVFILSLVLIPFFVQAQSAQSDCRTITKDTYQSCCGDGKDNPGQPNAYVCFVYNGGTKYNTTGSSTTTTTTSTSGTGTIAPSDPRYIVCTNATSTIKQKSDAACDKEFLQSSGLLTDACAQAPRDTSRWINLGCASINGGFSGKAPAGNGPVIRGGSSQNTGIINNVPIRGATNNTLNNSSSSCSAIQFNSLIDILLWVKCLITAIFIPMMFSLAFLFFLWGVFKFMTSSGNKDKDDSKKYIWYGLVGLFVMVSVYGIIKLAGNVFGLNQGLPYLQTQALDKSTTK